MILFGPGSFIFYRKHSSKGPPWPALVCPDDMAPNEVHEQRPRDYNTLILLMEKFEFAWALAGEMNEYDPGYVTEPGSANKQLKEACDLALNSVLDNLDLDHWRAVIWERNKPDNSSSPEPIPGYFSDSDAILDSDADSDIRTATKLSLLDEERRNASNSNQPKLAFRPGLYKDSNSDTETNSGFHDSKQPRLAEPSRVKRHSPGSQYTLAQSSAKRQRLASAEHKVKPAQPRTPSAWVDLLVSRTDVEGNQGETMPDTLSDSQSSSPIIGEKSSVRRSNKVSPKQSLLNEESFKPSTNRSGDKSRGLLMSEHNQYADAEIEDHEAFVKFVVGESGEIFYVLKEEVDRRTYFANNNLGANCMVKVGKKNWEFQRPCLRTMDPDDFRQVADYISTGSFGLRTFENADQIKEAIQQCAQAWAIADALVMEDLLDHIMEKIDMIRPWGMLETLAFGSLVYQAEDSPLPVYTKMKNALADFVAEHYLDYLRKYPTALVDRFEQAPQFMIDVHTRTVERTRRNRECSQGGASAVHMDEENNG